MNYFAIIPIISLATLLSSPTQADDKKGDPASGERFFNNYCVFCHGKNGESHWNMVPNLMGQKEGYIITQLKDFQSLKRRGYFMNFMGSGGDSEVGDVAAYLSQLEGTPHNGTPPEDGDANAGATKFRSVCIKCHGEGGKSLPYYLPPNIARQKAFYIRRQLVDFRKGTRIGTEMNKVAATLTDTEIKDLSAYLWNPDAVPNPDDDDAVPNPGDNDAVPNPYDGD